MPHGEGRNEIRTAKGRVKREEMGAKQGLEAGWWWEQRQASGRRRGGLQQLQQAALEGRQGQGSRAAYPGRGPKVR